MVIILFCDWPIAQVLDDDQECALGVLEFPLCQILPHADLTLEQRFQLDHSGLDSLISMRLVLRVNLSPFPQGGQGVVCPSTKYLPCVAKKFRDGFIFFNINFRILSAIFSSNIASPNLFPAHDQCMLSHDISACSAT